MRVLRLSKEKMYAVVTYDISSTKKRNKIVALLESYGFRVQKSVFEIELTESQYFSLKKQLNKILEYGHKKWTNIDKRFVISEESQRWKDDSIKFYILSKVGEWNLDNRIDGLWVGYKKIHFEDVMIL